MKSKHAAAAICTDQSGRVDLPKRLRQGVLAACWQHPHELVEGAKGLAQLELNLEAGQVHKVTGKGSVVEGVEPAQRATPHMKQQVLVNQAKALGR